MKKIFTFAAALLFGMSAMAEELTLTLADVTPASNWMTVDGVGAVTNKSGNAWSSPDMTCEGTTGYKTGSSYFTVQTFNEISSLIITGRSTSNRTLSSVEVGEAASSTTAVTYTWSNENSTDYAVVKNACDNQFTIDFNAPVAENGFVKITLSGNLDIVAVTFVTAGAPVNRYTVTYMDGETVLGTESVKEGENATKASSFEAKSHATFDGWFTDAELTTPADFTAAITADKTFYGKWTAEPFTASTSINIEQLVLDNGKGYDIAGALTTAHIAYANIDALDSLDSSKGSNNEPYLGLKLKKKDAYLELAVNSGDVLRVKFGAVAAAFKVSVDGVESSMETSTANTVYELTADKAEYVRFTIVTDNKTVVFKQIMINQEIQEIDQPAVVNDATLATLTLDGVAIEGFAAGKKEYTVTLAAGTTLPVVAATAHDAAATVGEISQATTLPGDATFTVTAADGTTTATYTIHFVLPRAIEYLAAPYETTIPADFELPNWLAGCTANLAYAGADTVVAGYDVIRFEKTDTVSMYVENVDSVIVDLSATGDRTVAIAVDGEEKANSGKFGKNTIKTLGAYIHSEGQVIVNIYGVNVTGGTTISRIKVTEYENVPTGLNNLEAVKAVKVIENGQIVIIKNGVRYNAVGAKL